MITMIVKMSAVVLFHTVLTVYLKKKYGDFDSKNKLSLRIGLIYGICGVLSSHFGVRYEHSILNIRDLSPLAAGLFFSPLSGIIAGLIAGIERYIIGVFFNIGSYTVDACYIATCTAGFVAALLKKYVFNGRKPPVTDAFFIGTVMEVFHMYMVFLTHGDDLVRALSVVKENSGGMIFFTGLGLFVEAFFLLRREKGWENPFIRREKSKMKLADTFRVWMFVFIFSALFIHLAATFLMNSQVAIEYCDAKLDASAEDIRGHYHYMKKIDEETKDENAPKRNIFDDLLSEVDYHVGREGCFDIISGKKSVSGDHKGLILPDEIRHQILEKNSGDYFFIKYFDVFSRCKVENLDGNILLVAIPNSEVFSNRDTVAYETVFSNILMIALIYYLLSMLIQKNLVGNLEVVNASLEKITGGDLEEKVNVYESTEFVSLSDSINQMVTSLKGYIAAAEKRVEQELIFAKSVQMSALPRNYDFGRKDFEIYASTNPAKSVGGDFYDFFFVAQDKLALVIADVSGKGIPAALFMMRSKTAIRAVTEQGFSPAEIMEKVNEELCEGNKEHMFVTVWLGIINLKTGVMSCANAGHEYPVIGPNGKEYEVYKDKHSPMLGMRKNITYSEYELKMEPGDCLFVYTDGIPDALGKDDEMYGLDRLREVLNNSEGLTMKQMLELVLRNIMIFAGNNEQHDDITMMGFRYNGK